ncbi:OLC1v1018929C1 [Oldenlandia corymbosa var. corymbosa]|uniref:OLC1v1018929C1 n=1 Tax=Oldenlandia corymbosa var. corymbosa TaxID=529605 RepID=A0AAV1ECX3_OLDCO|nr:OLC1v1018929C1 [Oldenlandia corymbosa var. corymbosa]
MEEMPSNILSRKRKQFPASISSEPSICAVTRSQYRRRRDSSGISSPVKLQKSQTTYDFSLEKSNSTRSSNSENGASLYLSIKDLRARGRRVFSPSGGIEVQNELGFDFGEGISNGSLKNSAGTLGFKNTGSGPGSILWSSFRVSDEEENEKCGNGGRFDVGSKDLEMGSGNQTPMDEKDAGMNKINRVESGKDCCEIQKEGSTPSTMVRKPCSRGKVYKSPSLFSYRRLLPFLADMVKEESCTIRSNGVGEDPQDENSINVNSISSPVSNDSDSAEHEHIGEDSSETGPLINGLVQKDAIQLEVVLPLFDDHGKQLPQTEEAVSLTDVPGRSDENGITEGNVLIEEHIQTTPPDSTILSELGLRDDEANIEVNLKTQNPVLPYASKGSDSTCHVSASEKVTSPAKRENTISTSKMFLNLCSRTKIYKTSNSFSYRRLLPYLMDVAKGSGHNDTSPKFSKDVESSQNSESFASSHNDVNLNEIKTFEFQEKQQDKCLEVDSPTGTNVPSGGNCLEVSAQLIIPSNETSLEKPNSACSENLSESDTLNGSLKERTSSLQHVQLNQINDSAEELQNADIQVCDHERNKAVEKLCSSVNHKTLPGESKLEANHQPLDSVKNCSSDDLVSQEVQLTSEKSVSPDQSPLKNGEFYFHRIGTPTKGILKRNPRGCRGLCSCLNCSSFRLHAERAFEFSKNQMLDAEEIALTLINELGELRDMLERSAVVGSDQTNIQVNQVKKGCERALAMEQQAKQRLSQMNQDLSAHCRTIPLERPRVKFARYTELKSIPERKSQGAPKVIIRDDNKK